MNYSNVKKIEFALAKDFVLIIFSALFLGLFSNVYIPLFFTPIPLVLQNSIAITYGYFLKSKKAYFSIILFILLGALGLPFFAKGAAGITPLLGASGGYIFSYAIAGYIIGKIFEKSTKNIAWTILLGHLIVLFCGCIWFSFFVGISKAFILGVLPFLPGDIFKTIVITKLIKLKKWKRLLSSITG